jgi:hypothetical protein
MPAAATETVIPVKTQVPARPTVYLRAATDPAMPTRTLRIVPSTAVARREPAVIWRQEGATAIALAFRRTIVARTQSRRATLLLKHAAAMELAIRSRTPVPVQWIAVRPAVMGFATALRMRPRASRIAAAATASVIRARTPVPARPTACQSAAMEFARGSKTEISAPWTAAVGRRWARAEAPEADASAIAIASRVAIAALTPFWFATSLLLATSATMESAMRMKTAVPVPRIAVRPAVMGPANATKIQAHVPRTAATTRPGCREPVAATGCAFSVKTPSIARKTAVPKSTPNGWRT